MRLVIIGAGGHGKVVADIARDKYEEIIFLDDGEVKKCGEYSVVGKSSEYYLYIGDSDFFVAIGNSSLRRSFAEKIELAGGTLATLVHSKAVVADGVSIGSGTAIMAGAVVNVAAVIGKGCIINTCSSVDHDCKIADFVHIAVGAHIAGTVSIGENTFIAAGVTIINNVDVCSDCIIGAGAVVVNDIENSGTYVGVPARKVI